jgi:hypothetical protein
MDLSPRLSSHDRKPRDAARYSPHSILRFRGEHLTDDGMRPQHRPHTLKYRAWMRRLSSSEPRRVIKGAITA